MARKSKLEFIQNKKKEWLWHFVSSNGKIIAWAGETYKTKAGAVKGWRSFAESLLKGNFTTKLETTIKTKAFKKVTLY